MRSTQVRKVQVGNVAISVIIPSYNGLKHVRTCLESLRAQRTRLAFEVIMVDSSTDGTDELVKVQFPEVKLWHFAKRCTVGRARHIGIAKAKGEYVFFLDVDCVAGHTWIEEMYKTIEETGADAVGGGMKNGTPGSITGSVGFYLEFFRVLAYDGLPFRTPFLVGGNVAYRKQVFETAKYYHEYSEERVGEDFVFNWQLSKDGKKLLFAPSVAVTHMNKVGVRRIMLLQYDLGLGACAYRFHLSPHVIQPLERLPVLSFLMPFAILPWIGFTLLKRRKTLEFLRFAALLPLCYVANNCWALGFYRELQNQRSQRSAATEALRAEALSKSGSQEMGSV